MSRPVQASPAVSFARPAAPGVTPSVSTDELDGPLCALSLYLSTAERALQATDIDRETLGKALQGAREQLADLTQKTAAACRQGR
jgi:hypothetical protein